MQVPFSVHLEGRLQGGTRHSPFETLSGTESWLQLCSYHGRSPSYRGCSRRGSQLGGKYQQSQEPALSKTEEACGGCTPTGKGWHSYSVPSKHEHLSNQKAVTTMVHVKESSRETQLPKVMELVLVGAETKGAHLLSKCCCNCALYPRASSNGQFSQRKWALSALYSRKTGS